MFLLASILCFSVLKPFRHFPQIVFHFMVRINSLRDEGKGCEWKRPRLSLEHKIDNLSQNAMCFHENDLAPVESAKVNQGVVTACWNPLYLSGGGEEGMGKSRSFSSCMFKSRKVKSPQCLGWIISSEILWVVPRCDADLFSSLSSWLELLFKKFVKV